MTRKLPMLLSLAALSPAAFALAVIAQTKQKTSDAPAKPQRIVYTTKGLPKPFATESVRNPPKVVAAPNGARLEVWGRPVGVTMIKDGSLLAVDDGGKKIWRVTYGGKK